MSENKYVEMILHLSEHQDRKQTLTEGYKIMSIANTREDDLYPCYLAAFQGGDSQLFQAQDDSEKREFYGTLGYHQARNEVESSMVLKDGIIKGFTLVVPYGATNRHISCMCVHKDHQRQGLGAYMLVHAIRESAAQGYRTITLWTETTMGAFQLYRGYGFEITREIDS